MSNSKSVTLRLNEQELNAITEFAQEEGLSQSAAIRMLLKRGLKQDVGSTLIKELSRDPSLRITLHRLIVLGIQ